MKYRIYTNNAQKLLDLIITDVKKGEGYTGNGILTWQIRRSQDGEEVLVHTTDQWDKKGCIELISAADNSFVEAIFYYWSTFQNNERIGNESKYMLGRFTELLLVHFEGSFDRISIT